MFPPPETCPTCGSITVTMMQSSPLGELVFPPASVPRTQTSFMPAVAKVILAVTFSFGLLNEASLAVIGSHAPPVILYSAEVMLEFPVVVSSTFAVRVVTSPATGGTGVATTAETIGGTPPVSEACPEEVVHVPLRAPSQLSDHVPL